MLLLLNINFLSIILNFELPHEPRKKKKKEKNLEKLGKKILINPDFYKNKRENPL